MASQVGGNLDYLESTPSKLTYKTVALGHTRGGITLSAKPQLRDRVVDEYGTNVVDVVITGHSVDLKTTLIERSMQTLKTVYLFGSQLSTSMWYLGGLPGATTGRAQAGVLLIHPLSMSSATTRDVTLYKVIVSDPGDPQIGTIGDDQVWNVTFRALFDETTNTFGKIGDPRTAA